MVRKIRKDCTVGSLEKSWELNLAQYVTQTDVIHVLTRSWAPFASKLKRKSSELFPIEP